MNIFQKWQQKKQNKVNEVEKNEEDTKKMTLEQIKKAYADLSADDKKEFSQSIKDRVDESVGEQEKQEGDEDTQTAKDRVDESEGMEKAGKHEDEREDAEQIEKMLEPLIARLDALEVEIKASKKEPKKVETETKGNLDWIADRHKY